MNMLMRFLVWMTYVPCNLLVRQMTLIQLLSTSPNVQWRVKFPYLAQEKLKPGQEVRRVAQLDWRIIDNDCSKTLVASGLQFFPLPVMHGEDYVCLGFLFGERSRVAYISDVSRFLPPTEYPNFLLSLFPSMEADSWISLFWTHFTSLFNPFLLDCRKVPTTLTFASQDSWCNEEDMSEESFTNWNDPRV